MNILILGSGGREHTLAWKLHQSKERPTLFVAPGNAGTASIATNIPMGVNEFDNIKKVVLQNEIQMIIVGPEDPLVNGIHDYFSIKGYTGYRATKGGGRFRGEQTVCQGVHGAA